MQQYLRKFVNLCLYRLAHGDALILLSLLGLLSGLVTGFVLQAFRYLIEQPQLFLLPDGVVDRYESLALSERFLFPVLFSLVLGLIYQFLLQPETRKVGVAHVLEYMALHQSRLPFKNFLLQLFAGAFSLVGGLSVGREGPAVHLGAAVSSLLADRLKLPDNSLRVLVACGAAAAISASFNTPIAGAIFAMEVVMMEYSIVAVIPVILASVSGAMVSRIFYGDAPAFLVPAMAEDPLQLLPYLLMVGLLCGCLAAAFNELVQRTTRLSREWPVLLKFLLAGLVGGSIAVYVPQVMGVGYDTVNSVLLGQLGLGLLVVVLVAKLIATSAAIGLGVPGGLIGPTMVMGACMGGVAGGLSQLLFPEDVGSAQFFAMVGMTAMMGANLQAPLAALMALVELTASTSMIFPGMLTIVIACLTSSSIFGQKAIFISMLNARQIQLHNTPIAQWLNRVSVASVMDYSVSIIEREVPVEVLKKQLATAGWLLVQDGDETLLSASDVEAYIDKLEQSASEVDLLSLPVRQLEFVHIHQRATLKNALEKMDRRSVDFLLVTGFADLPGNIGGVITRRYVENHYRHSN